MTNSSESLLDIPTGAAPAAIAAPTRGVAGKLAFPVAYVAVAAMLAGIFLGILKINNGTFIYSLDDPYIHLALSDQIRHGNYGLYPGTHAAPSSSILFPFILAIAAATALHPYFPLLINICALFFTVEVTRRFLRHLRLGEDDFAMVVQAGLVTLAVLAFNLAGVVFTGLEHSLHIATVAAIVYGLALFLDRGRMPYWLPVAIVLSPLIRYEGLAFSIGALLVLALRGRILAALATFAAIIALVGGFSLFLIRQGLPPLPSSILSKSEVAAGGVGSSHAGLLFGVYKNVEFMDTHSTGILLLLALVIALCVIAGQMLLKPRRWSSKGLMSLALLCLVGGHAVAGRFGWLERYELYAIVGVTLMLVYIGQAQIRSVLSVDRKDRLIFAAGTAAALLVIGDRYLHATADTPHASNNIYEQQMQMHHFVNDYWRGPVAVNDLGLVSYHNPYPVLDLGGLGSEKARLLTANHANAETYKAFVAENGIHLVIVFKEWFPDQIPDSWRPVGTMTLSRPHLSAAHDDVQFYATDAATAATVREELMAFQKTLPPRVQLEIY